LTGEGMVSDDRRNTDKQAKGHRNNCPETILHREHLQLGWRFQ
jgi:hypothetical protein